MIEIVFGESACGSLKIAQTYGKGKYRGSAVSIFMRHEDGSVPSSDEMKKAQLQAQEQERIAWENAIPVSYTHLLFVNLMKKSLTFRLWQDSQKHFDFLRCKAGSF